MNNQEWTNLQEALLSVLAPIIQLALAGMIGTAIGLGILEMIRDLAGWILHLAGDQD